LIQINNADQFNAAHHLIEDGRATAFAGAIFSMAKCGRLKELLT